MKYESLKLNNQLCFPLYACSREIIRQYKPLLDEIGLTYTQYIVMMVMWEEKNCTVKELGERLHLDSGTLTPLLKRLEKEGLVTRQRSEQDERSLVVSLTKEGETLKKKALYIPEKMQEGNKLTEEEATQLYSLLYKIIQ